MSEPSIAPDDGQARQLRRTALASSVGSALEYYDFALYSLASSLVFGKVFFPALGQAASAAASFATLAVGFLARPLGAVFFGSLGERIGRKAVLMITISLMGVASTLIGMLPTGEQIGMWAPALLVLLRLLQGFGAGAEQAGAATLMAEAAPPRRRGFYSALPFTRVMLGTLLASAVFFVLETAPERVVLGWAWRAPFLVSAVLLVAAVLIRTRLQESPTFVALEEQEQISERPLRELLRMSRPVALRGVGLRMAENGGSYIYQALSITYIDSLGAQPATGPFAIALGSVVGLFVTPFAGALSDKLGRMTVYRCGALVQLALACAVWPLLSLADPVVSVVAIAVAYGLGVNMMLGAQGATLPELFGSRRRYVGVAVVREFSAIIGGGVAPFVGALLLAWSGSWAPLAGYVIVLTLITLVTTSRTPETRARDLTLASDAVDDTDEQIQARPAPLARSYRAG